MQSQSNGDRMVWYNDCMKSTWPIFDHPQAQIKLDAILRSLHHERSQYTVYPDDTHLFNAFNQCSYEQLKVIIIGQDPYHTPGCAHGLAFSVPNGVKVPPSLKNIMRELESDCGVIRRSSDLTDWAQQGILLLNTSLSVRAHQANSHHHLGWNEWIQFLIQGLIAETRPLCFVLWGNHAQKFKTLLNGTHHTIICGAHPSPLSAHRGFFKTKPFSQIDAFLNKCNYESIMWGDHQ